MGQLYPHTLPAYRSAVQVFTRIFGIAFVNKFNESKSRGVTGYPNVMKFAITREFMFKFFLASIMW
jgi:hypothetical protein